MAHEVPAAGRLVGWLSNEGLPVGVVAAGGSKEEQPGNHMRTRSDRSPDVLSRYIPDSRRASFLAPDPAASVAHGQIGGSDGGSAAVSSRWAGGRAPVAALPADQQARFRAQLVALPVEIEVLHLRHLAWPMARLQHQHRRDGRQLSAAMVEALAAAHALDAAIAVSRHDVGPNLKAAAAHDGIAFHVM